MSRYPMRRKKRQVFNPHEISFNLFEGGRPGMVLNFLSVDKNAYSPLVDRIPACTGREVCIPGALGRGCLLGGGVSGWKGGGSAQGRCLTGGRVYGRPPDQRQTPPHPVDRVLYTFF